MGAPNGNTFGDYPYEPYQKIWDLRVFCLPTSTTDQTDTIRLNFQVVHTGYLPPAMIGGKTAKYTMRMVDNKSFAGAPANGTTWDIPVPASNLAVMTTWHTISLPQLVISAANVDAAMSEGYQMQFIQTVVPEPSSLMVLAGGLMGLAGYGIRRRRS
jgi:hypothetical protein